MRYLWDLLDLSTADNLALHISNLLCECEEHYYQRLLEVTGDNALPYDPVYSPQRAAWRAAALASTEALPELSQIGRASCRERGESCGGGAAVVKEKLR